MTDRNAEIAYEHCDGTPVRYVWVVWEAEDEIYGVYTTQEAAKAACAEVSSGDGDYTLEELRHG